MLVLSRDCDTVLHIGPDVQVKVLSIKKRRVKLGIEAPSNVRVWRDEIVSGLSDQGLDEEEVLGASVAVGRFRTLVVEDDPAHAQLIRNALVQSGLPNLRVAGSGAEAVEELDRAEDDGNQDYLPIGLVILDYHLPDVSGLEVLRHIRATAALKTTPVVVFSAEDRDCVVRSCLEAGANAFVTKSADYEKFCRSIARITAFWSSEPSLPTPAEADGSECRQHRAK